MTYRAARRLAALGLLCGAAQVHGETLDPWPASTQSTGFELFASTDSDDTEVVKLLGRFSWKDEGPDRYQGVAVEQAWFRPQGQSMRNDQRVYADFADKIGDKWLWKAKIGTDGHSWLGSANVRANDWSEELFLERDIVETPRGVDEGVYYTIVGASFDIPASRRNVFTVTAGLQEFTGKNERLHVRGSYVHVVKPDLGLSAQFRARYFHSTAPGEFDYYSPRNFVQLLPVVQLRRFTKSGWMVLGAVGYGAQKATGGSWQSARLADLRVESPQSSRDLRLFAQLQYSNNSLSGAGNYHYGVARFGLTKRF